MIESADGRRVRIRPIEPGDKQLLVEGLAALSDRSIHQRFLAARPRFSSRELRYLTEVDGRDHIALVALLDGGPVPLVGVARCVRRQPESQTAEMAIVVRDDLQGRGLGRALALALRELAWAAGIRAFVATMLSDNQAARRLLQAVARTIDTVPQCGGLCELRAELAEP